jgi:AraC-like DNA-binding protein
VERPPVIPGSADGWMPERLRPVAICEESGNATPSVAVQRSVDATIQDDARYWKAEALGGLELLRGRYRNRAFPRHAHDTYVVSVIARGREVLRIHGTTHHVPTLGIVTLNPGVWHENHGRRDERYALRSFYLDARAVREIAGESCGPMSADAWFRDPVVTSQPLLALDLLRLHRRLEHEPADLAAEEVLRESLHALLVRAGGSGTNAARLEDGRSVDRLQAYLVDHLASRVSLQELAGLVDRSPCHLLRSFRTATGVTPHQFQIQMRIRRAAALLRAGRPIRDTALDVGFSDQSHLTRHFRRSLGVSPGRFARSVKNVQDRLEPLNLRS